MVEGGMGDSSVPGGMETRSTPPPHSAMSMSWVSMAKPRFNHGLQLDPNLTPESRRRLDWIYVFDPF